MSVDRSFRRNLERVLRERDVTQAELARRLGVSPQYFDDVLDGRHVRIPGSLARILGALEPELPVVPGAVSGTPSLPDDLAALLESAGPLERHRGAGEPCGSRVHPARPSSLSDAVIGERDERIP